MATLCAGTPTLTVRDNRGLDVRTLRYNRNAAGIIATQCVDAQAHNVLGQPAASQDPRFFGGATLNFQYTPALSGQVLKSVSVDAGTTKACTDIAGQPVWHYSEGRVMDFSSPYARACSGLLAQQPDQLGQRLAAGLLDLQGEHGIGAGLAQVQRRDG